MLKYNSLQFVRILSLVGGVGEETKFQGDTFLSPPYFDVVVGLRVI
jgi:hypothetical protein